MDLDKRPMERRTKLQYLAPINFNIPDLDEKPLTDIALFEGLFPLLPRVAREIYRPKIKTDESQAPAFSIEGVQVHGFIKECGVDPVGEDWKELLDQEVAANIAKKPEIKALKPLQAWIFTMITYDYPGIVYANRGFRKTVGFALPLVQKMRTSVIGRPSTSAICDAKVLPVALIITATDAKAEHVAKTVKWAASGTKVYTRLVSQDTFQAENVPTRIDILVGKTTRVTDFLAFHKLSLSALECVLFVECEHVKVDKQGEEMEKAADDLMKALKAIRKEVPFTLLIYNEHTKEKSDALRQFLPDFDHCSKIEQTCVTYQNPPQFKIIQCNVETRQVWEFKAAYLRSIVSKVKKENDDPTRRTGRKCVIVVGSVMTANYLAAFLSSLHDRVFPVVTRDSDSVSVESARLRVRTGESNFYICDYKGLTYIEPGYIDYVAMFDLPPPESFQRKIFSVINMSTQLSFKAVYAFFDPIRDEAVTLPLLKMLMVLHQKVPRSLYNQAKNLIQLKKSANTSNDTNYSTAPEDMSCE